jgi:23S rRNA (adenine2030-N6)-methyltransferase
MNYRHIYHAGNHADVFKHVVLLGLLNHLARKASPFCVMDTHAGAGEYLLHSEEAGKTAEAEGGILKFIGKQALPELLQQYLNQIIACNPVGTIVQYPGSPLITAHSMRDQDRLLLCEIQHQEVEQLRKLFKHDQRVAVHQRNGYEAMQALLPPKDKDGKTLRGLVLIDPPYESQEAEFDTVLQALQGALQRWPTACYAVWYPIKQRKTLNAFFRNIEKLAAKSILDTQLLIREDNSPLRLNGSGMLLINPPFEFDKALTESLKSLTRLLEESPRSGQYSVRWLKNPS